MDVIAWIGLITAWLLLVLTLKFVSLVLRVLKQTRRLAEMCRDAAVGLSVNLSDEESFAEFERLIEQLPDAVRRLPRDWAVARPRVSSVSHGIGRRLR